MKIIGEAEKIKGQHKRFICQCDCGNIMRVTNYNLNITKKCHSCAGKENAITTHGKTNTPEYRIWTAIIQRCCNKNNPTWDLYGGRGIAVSKRWLKFENFILDMGVRPSNKHSIDRIDNSKGYNRTNCRWSLSTEQQRNKRTSRLLTCNGITKNLVEWVSTTGIPGSTITNRLSRGWSEQKTLSTPSNKLFANNRASGNYPRSIK